MTRLPSEVGQTKDNPHRGCTLDVNWSWRRREQVFETVNTRNKLVFYYLRRTERPRNNKSDIHTVVNQQNQDQIPSKRVIRNNVQLSPSILTRLFNTCRICNRCETDAETMYHLVCLCPTLAKRRFCILGGYVLNLEEIRQVSLTKIVDFLTPLFLETSPPLV